MHAGQDRRRSPLVSVVMPVYAADPEFLRKAVASIVAQSTPEWELVVVEDPSDRPAGGVLQAFKDARIRHILNATRTGQLAQRNRTLQEARGEFIAFMDADDVAHPFRLVKQLNFLRLRGVFSGNPKLMGMCDQLYTHRDWLWTFLDLEGVEPTNNASERALRPAVIWRKLSFGTKSAAGSRFVETILTVVETCHRQSRNSFEYITPSLLAGV
jgi:glycosyltransferase involved in cell wall biosynthesis